MPQWTRIRRRRHIGLHISGRHTAPPPIRGGYRTLVFHGAAGVGPPAALADALRRRAHGTVYQCMYNTRVVGRLRRRSGPSRSGVTAERDGIADRRTPLAGAIARAAARPTRYGAHSSHAAPVQHGPDQCSRQTPNTRPTRLGAGPAGQDATRATFVARSHTEPATPVGVQEKLTVKLVLHLHLSELRSYIVFTFVQQT